MSICPIPDGVNYDHLVKVIPMKFLHCEVNISTLVINKYSTGDNLRHLNILILLTLVLFLLFIGDFSLKQLFLWSLTSDMP